MTELNQYCILHDDNIDQTNPSLIVSANNESDLYCNDNFNNLKNEHQKITKKKCCDRELSQGQFSQIDPDNKTGIQFYKDRQYLNSYRVCGKETIEECNNEWPVSWTSDKDTKWNKYDNYIKCLFNETSPELENNNIGHLTLNHNTGHSGVNFINKSNEVCPPHIKNTDLLKYLVKSNKNNNNINNNNLISGYNDINNLNSKINIITSDILNQQNKYNNKQNIIYLLNIIIIAFIIIGGIFIYSKTSKINIKNKIKLNQ
jgi:hypothetical protein